MPEPFAGDVERLPGGGLRQRIRQLSAKVGGVVSGSDNRSMSQRIAFLAFFTRVLSAVLALGSQALMARWMGEHEYGVFVVVWVAAVIFGGLSCVGFQMSIVRFAAEYLERKEDGLLRGVLVGVRAYGLVISTSLALIGSAALYLLGDSVPAYYVIPFYLAFICLPMLAVGEIQDGMARAFNWAGLALTPTFIYRPLAILIILWLATQVGYPADAVTAMIASIIGTYTVSVYQALALRRRIRKTVPAGPRIYQPAMWLAVSLPIFLVEGFFNLLTNVDILIVGVLQEPDQAAIYFATVKTLAIVHFVYFAVRAGTAQHFSRYYVSGDTVGLQSFVRDTVHWTFWPSLLVSGALLLFGNLLLSLFGPAFTEGYPLLIVFVIGLLARASVGAAESLLSMAGQQKACAAVYAAVFILNVALNFLLIPQMGLMGAAVATATSLVAEAIGLAVICQTRLGISSFIGFALFGRRPRPAEVN